MKVSFKCPICGNEVAHEIDSINEARKHHLGECLTESGGCGENFVVFFRFAAKAHTFTLCPESIQTTKRVIESD